MSDDTKDAFAALFDEAFMQMMVRHTERERERESVHRDFGTLATRQG